MAFRFPLEALLRQRRRLLELAQMALAREMRREISLRGVIRHLRSRRQEGLEELARLGQEGMAAGDYLIRRWYLDGLSRQIERTQRDMARCQQDVARQRRAVVEASQNKKMVERLKEKACRRYEVEENQRQAKLLDEFAILGFTRRQGARRGSS